MNFFTKLSLATRLSDWRFSFVPFIVGCVYFWLWWFKFPFGINSLWLLLSSLITTAGFASLGYLINEWFDKATDAKAGKLNRLSVLPSGMVLGLFLVALLLTFLPWVYLPANAVSVGLIAAELLAFLLYSLPLPRFKAVPVVSNFLDALYAYVIPILLSFNTFKLAAKSHNDADVVVIAILGSLTFFAGIRNIVVHQVDDIFYDKKAGLLTLPRLIGVDSTNRIILLCLCLEIILALIGSAFMLLYSQWFYLWLAVVLFSITFSWMKLRAGTSFRYLSISDIRHLPDWIYQIYFALFSLLLLLTTDVNWALIVPLHALLLVPAFIFRLLVGYTKMGFYWIKFKIQQWVLYPLSLLVNYSIYYFFKLLGIDLKARNQSALQVLMGFFKRSGKHNNA